MDTASHPAPAITPRSRSRAATPAKQRASKGAAAAAAGMQPAAAPAAAAADLLSALAALQQHPGAAAPLQPIFTAAPAAAPAAARSEGAAASNGNGRGAAAAPSAGGLSSRQQPLSSIDRAMDHIRQGTHSRRAPSGTASNRRATFAADATGPHQPHVASPTSRPPAGPAAPAATALSPAMHLAGPSAAAAHHAAAPAGEVSSDDVSSMQQGPRRPGRGAEVASRPGSRTLLSTLTPPSRSQATTSAGSLATTRSGGSRRKGATPSRASLQ